MEREGLKWNDTMAKSSEFYREGSLIASVTLRLWLKSLEHIYKVKVVVVGIPSIQVTMPVEIREEIHTARKERSHNKVIGLHNIPVCLTC